MFSATIRKHCEVIGEERSRSPIKKNKKKKGTSFFMWDILLPKPEACIKASSRGRTTKDLRTENEGRRCTNVAIFEVPLKVIGTYLLRICHSTRRYWVQTAIA